MALLTIDWSNPLTDTGGTTRGGHGALWVFGVVIDARTLGSGRFVHRSPDPRGRSIVASVEPIDGLATAGLIALWSDWQGKPGQARSYARVAAAALDRLVAQRVPAANVRDLQLGVEQDLTDTVRRGWSWLGPLADNHLASAHRLLTLDGPAEEPLDLRLAGPGGERVLRATLRYGRRAAAVDLRPAKSAAPTAPPLDATPAPTPVRTPVPAR